MRTLLHISILAALPLAAMLAGCQDYFLEKAPPEPQPMRSKFSFQLDVPRIMRGTIASETILLGYEPTVVRGYGLVVGLNDTGSRDIPPSLRAHMLAEMARRGVGQATRGMGAIDPNRMLDSSDTAVVIVEAIIPPGAVGQRTHSRSPQPGTKFDVRVYADPRTGTTSLEGGRLYTCELHPMAPGELLPPTGSLEARALAEAKGPIFVNPFAEPGAIGRDTINRNIGRILNGGEVLEDMPIKLRLASPSHARAEIIQASINTRFPQEPGMRDPTARGESDESIAIHVPPSYRDQPDTFVEKLRHTTIRQANPEGVASSIKRTLVANPQFAADASWRWEALGEKALPVIRDLYDYPEEMPRMAALRAGARLSDPLVVPSLIEMAGSASAGVRRQSVELLGGMQLDPRIDLGLRTLLSDDDVDVRLAAYESLIKRGDPYLTRLELNGKFYLDLIESDRPMIYVTQVGRPRIAVFGTDLELTRPLLMSTWSGRLIIQDRDDQIEVYFRDERTGSKVVQLVNPGVEEFITFLAHQTTIEEPEPGLGLSYAQTVGALYEVWRQEFLDADFRAEQDRVLAAILRLQEGSPITDRPEFADPETGVQPVEVESRPEFGPEPPEPPEPLETPEPLDAGGEDPEQIEAPEIGTSHSPP